LAKCESQGLECGFRAMVIILPAQHVYVDGGASRRRQRGDDMPDIFA
jgi:hypothetical protein